MTAYITTTFISITFGYDFKEKNREGVIFRDKVSCRDEGQQ